MTARALMTSRGRVLYAIAVNPDIRIREIADAVGITQRSTYRILSELVETGDIRRVRVGRRNRYVLNGHADT